MRQREVTCVTVQTGRGVTRQAKEPMLDGARLAQNYYRDEEVMNAVPLNDLVSQIREDA